MCPRSEYHAQLAHTMSFDEILDLTAVQVRSVLLLAKKICDIGKEYNYSMLTHMFHVACYILV